MKNKLWIAAVAVVAVAIAGCENPTLSTTQSVVTGVTITGAGVTGTGGGKEVVVTTGTAVDLNVTVTKSGTPSLVESWTSADPATVSVDASQGVVTGRAATSAGVVVSVKVGAKTDSILVKVVAPTPGLTLAFDTDKLEFQNLDATVFINGSSPQPPQVVKSAGGVITMTNYDGTFKQTTTGDTLQGSSFLLYKTPLTGDFEVKAAVKLLSTAGPTASDKYLSGLGFFTVDAAGALTVADTRAAVMAKRSKPDLRSVWSKANAVGGLLGAGSPNIATGVVLSDYHLLTVRRIGTVVTYDENGTSATVSLNTNPANDGVTNTTGEIWSTLSGAVKVGVVTAGVTADIEGLVINQLNPDGTVLAELYKAGALPAVSIPVDSIVVTDAAAATASSIDLNGKTLPVTLALTTALTPSIANTGTTITYAVKPNADGSADSNVSVDAAGVVSVSGTGDGSATLVATSANGKSAEYVLTLTDSSLVVASVSIPTTLDTSVGLSKTLTATVLPSTAANKTVTWSSSNTAILIDAVTGVITVAAGTAAGTTSQVTATSANGVVSNACLVTVVAVTTTTKSWNFQTLPSGWSDGVNTTAGLPNVDYGQGLTLTTSTRTMKMVTAGAVPTSGGAAFSIGYLQPGGAGVFGNLGTVSGNFTITINYCGAGTGSRYPAILVDGTDVTLGAPAPASTGTTDGKTFTFNYVGPGGVVTVSSISNAIRVYDLSLTN